MKKKYRVKNFVDLANMPDTKVIEFGSKFGIKHNEGFHVASVQLLECLNNSEFIHDFDEMNVITIDSYNVEKWMCEDLGPVIPRTSIRFNSKEEMAQAIIKYGKLYRDIEDSTYLSFDVNNNPTEPFQFNYPDNTKEVVYGLWNFYNEVFYIEIKTC